MANIKIIATIGPGSNGPETLKRLKDRGVNFFRINLSHTNEEDIDSKIKDLLGYNVPIILDTEGSQVRTANTSEIEFPEGELIKLHSREIECNSQNLFFKPIGVTKRLKEGDLISLEFNSVLLRVVNTLEDKTDHIECKVIMGGKVGGKKAVQIESPTFNLPAFSKKDHLAIELAKKHGIKHFTLSFMESPEQVSRFRSFIPEASLYSKIESLKGLNNFIEIAKASEGVLIDRGDLSSQVSLEKIPFIQKYIIKKVRELNKEAFVATNTLEQMAFALKPNKAEVNDIINTILDGATGIALTKETAVGKYPVETVNMLSNLVEQTKFINIEKPIDQAIESTNYLKSPEVPELLIKPHGGKLIDRFDSNYNKPLPKKTIEMTEENLMDVEQIAVGSFSPLEGFLGSKDLHSVVDNYKLTNGTVWPLPIILAVNEQKASEISAGEDILLSFNGDIHAILHLEEIYEINKDSMAEKIFGTTSPEHPGVTNFMNLDNKFLGGKVTLIKKRRSNNKYHELTPKQTRKVFSERGWSKIVGFHTRNVPHKGHEFIQLESMSKGLCDGLFVHPIIGKKKAGDFESNIIINTYEKMISDFYPKSKVVMGTFASYSRYGGPREAIFTALARKNFGCSHFVVGRDHTGVGNFYSPTASHEIFNKFTKEELGITPIIFNKVFYSELEGKHIHELDIIEHPEENQLHISGSQAREILQKGQQPPGWFMRPEISSIIIEKIKNGEDVFVK